MLTAVPGHSIRLRVSEDVTSEYGVNAYPRKGKVSRKLSGDDKVAVCMLRLQSKNVARAGDDDWW